MNKKIKITFGVLAVLCIFISCNKNEHDVPVPQLPGTYSNINLRVQSPAVIRNAIKGRWQVQYDSLFGFTGWTKTYPLNRYVSFLENDSLKIESNGVIALYGKADYVWGRSAAQGDSVYMLTIPGQVIWIMDKIFNDTLKIDEFPHLHYLTRKP